MIFGGRSCRTQRRESCVAMLITGPSPISAGTLSTVCPFHQQKAKATAPPPASLQSSNWTTQGRHRTTHYPPPTPSATRRLVAPLCRDAFYNWSKLLVELAFTPHSSSFARPPFGPYCCCCCCCYYCPCIWRDASTHSTHILCRIPITKQSWRALDTRLPAHNS